MNKTTIELFKEFLSNNPVILAYQELFGVFTCSTYASKDSEVFMNSFNHWNETHGIIFSVVKINSCTFVVYSSNGVKITDLTGENRL